jgi:uncharacterized protein (DUF1015 family)
MSALFPFRALRPAPDVAARVASVPYDVVTTDEAKALVAGNDLSFLRVTRSEVDLPAGTNPYDDRVYEQALRNFEDLKRAAPLILEENPSLYLYQLRMGAHTQMGVAGCFSLEEYGRSLIKRHEHTRKDKEDDRTRHIVELRAQTGVVFLTYRASAAIDAIVARAAAARPLYDFEAGDGVSHTIWRVTGPELGEAFKSIPALYVADGHHRAASAARAWKALPQSVEAARFLAVAFPHTQVQILPYHRVVKDLAGRTPDEFLAALRVRFPIADGGPAPARRGQVAMYVAGRWHVLTLADASLLSGSSAATAGSLDVALLEREILGPVLKVGDIRTDKRIDFVGGARGTAELERRVVSGEAAVAFSMYPVTIDDLMSVADAGGVMPPKSTWFEPKLRDGLLTHLI